MATARIQENNYSFTKDADGSVRWPAAALLEEAILEETPKALAWIMSVLTSGEDNTECFTIPMSRLRCPSEPDVAICDEEDLEAESFKIELNGVVKCDRDWITDQAAFEIRVVERRGDELEVEIEGYHY